MMIRGKCRDRVLREDAEAIIRSTRRQLRMIAVVGVAGWVVLALAAIWL